MPSPDNMIEQGEFANSEFQTTERDTGNRLAMPGMTPQYYGHVMQGFERGDRDYSSEYGSRADAYYQTYQTQGGPEADNNLGRINPAAADQRQMDVLVGRQSADMADWTHQMLNPALTTLSADVVSASKSIEDFTIAIKNGIVRIGSWLGMGGSSPHPQSHGGMPDVP
jgi:hypothetical protein